MRVMDYDTADDFYNWLETQPEDQQHAVEQGIHTLLREEDLVGRMSWPEMREEARARGYIRD